MKKHATVIIRLFLFYTINLLLLLIFAQILIEVYRLTFPLLSHNLSTIDGAFDAAAILLVAYGVVMEESDSVMKILLLYKKNENVLNKKIDSVSHDFGLVMLILGLFIEIPVQLIKVSNTIVNTVHVELFLILLSFLLLLIAFLIVIIYSIKLVIKLMSR